MLKLMPIPRVLQMNEVIPTRSSAPEESGCCDGGKGQGATFGRWSHAPPNYGRAVRAARKLGIGTEGTEYGHCVHGTGHYAHGTGMGWR